MKKIILAFATVLSASAMAEVSYSMPALEAGFKWNAMDMDGTSSGKQSLGIQLGGSTVFNFTPQFGLRTGLFYSERTFKFDILGSDMCGKITYADVPLHLMFKFEDYAGIYLGPSLSMKLGNECSAGCPMTDVKAMIMPMTFGAQFKFTPNLGLNLFFESVPSELAVGLKNSRGLGLNILLAFD